VQNVHTAGEVGLKPPGMKRATVKIAKRKKAAHGGLRLVIFRFLEL
jgi:hypothetical protein